MGHGTRSNLLCDKPCFLALMLWEIWRRLLRAAHAQLPRAVPARPDLRSADAATCAITSHLFISTYMPAGAGTWRRCSTTRKR